jgi:hypothetical protein
VPVTFACEIVTPVLVLLITKMDFAEVAPAATLAKSSEAGLRRSWRVRAHGRMEMGELAAAVLVLGATATVTAAL